MSDNVRDELADIILDFTMSAHENAARILAYLAERGMVVLGPDGEPLNVRPALRALGLDVLAISHGATVQGTRRVAERQLEIRGITGPLADACLAAAEVEP